MKAIFRVFTEFREYVEKLFGRARQRRLSRIAVFIDADNVHESGIRYAFGKLNQGWNPVYRRGYGCGLLNRAEMFRKYGILPIDVVSNTPGKNAADMALLIDAMTELHAHRVDAFCLVTGDGDFTRLAIAIRERSYPVLGFGSASTPASLRAACTEFHVFQNPADSKVMKTKQVSAKRKARKPLIVRDRSEFATLLQNLTQNNEKVTFRRINHEANKRDPNFSARQYGATSLKSLMKDLPEFEVRPVIDRSGVIRDYEVAPAKEESADIA
jgi:hypothetical protein